MKVPHGAPRKHMTTQSAQPPTADRIRRSDKAEQLPEGGRGEAKAGATTTRKSSELDNSSNHRPMRQDYTAPRPRHEQQLYTWPNQYGPSDFHSRVNLSLIRSYELMTCTRLLHLHPGAATSRAPAAQPAVPFLVLRNSARMSRTFFH